MPHVHSFHFWESVLLAYLSPVARRNKVMVFPLAVDIESYNYILI